MEHELRWNKSLHFWEHGYWYTSSAGNTLWHHIGIASSLIPMP
jgi:hypothetical protein